jgi:cation diffusion facilitator family transporter
MSGRVVVERKSALLQEQHSHVFLGEGHERAERQAWAVIWLCGAMMALEVVGGILFGSVALIADGLHMSTHASALLLAALAYSYSRRHAGDRRFTFGTGKLGDLAGFTSAVILAMIAVLIGYEAVTRFIHPVPIHFREAIPIAFLALAVNLTSAWLLSRAGHHHHHHHGHPHDSGAQDGHRIATAAGPLHFSVFETDHPPVFRLSCETGPLPDAQRIEVETLRPDGSEQVFTFENRGAYLQSIDTIPEPHEFTALLRIGGEEHAIAFEEHEPHAGLHRERHAHGSAAATRDNNMRAAIIHVAADAAVSVLVIVGLSLARAFGWLWMDPLAGTVGALVIASWSFGLIRDTGSVLLDMSPDHALEESICGVIAAQGDRLTDLHIWRLGPGHLGAIVAVETSQARSPEFYRETLSHFPMLSHITVEVGHAA